MKTYIEQLNAEVHFTLNDLTPSERQICALFARHDRDNVWGANYPECLEDIISRTYSTAYINRAKKLYARRWAAAYYCLKQFEPNDCNLSDTSFCVNVLDNNDPLIMAVLDAAMVHNPDFAYLVAGSNNFEAVRNSDLAQKLAQKAYFLGAQFLANGLKRADRIEQLQKREKARAENAAKHAAAAAKRAAKAATAPKAPAFNLANEIRAIKSLSYYTNENRLICAVTTNGNFNGNHRMFHSLLTVKTNIPGCGDSKFRVNLSALNATDQAICRETARNGVEMCQSTGWIIGNFARIYAAKAQQLYQEKITRVMNLFTPALPISEILAPIVVDLVINTPEFMALELHGIWDPIKQIESEQKFNALIARVRPAVFKAYNRMCDRCLYGPAKAQARIEQLQKREKARAENAARHGGAALKRAAAAAKKAPTPVSVLNMSDEEFDKLMFTPDYDYTPVKEKDLTKSGPVTSDFLDWCVMTLTRGADPKYDRLPQLLYQELIENVVSEFDAPEDVARQVVTRDAPFDYLRHIRALAYSMQHNKQLFSFMAWCNNETDNDPDMEEEIIYNLRSSLDEYLSGIKNRVLATMSGC